MVSLTPVPPRPLPTCQKCGSDRIFYFSAKHSDCFFAKFRNKDLGWTYAGEHGLGGGDYCEGRYCFECGQIQGKFPLADPIPEE